MSTVIENLRYKLSFWKPNKSNKGFAAFLEYNPDQENAGVMLTFMPQAPTGERKFENEKKFIAKLGPNDLGDMLAVIEGWQEGIGALDDKTGYYKGLYHQSDSGNSSIKLEKSKNHAGLTLSLYVKRGDTSTNGFINLTLSEAAQLKSYINFILPRFFEETYAPKA